jgi:predicted secreted protein
MNQQPRTVSWILAAMVALGVASAAWGQPSPYPPPQNVLQLSATGTLEVQQDLLTLTLTTTREGSDPNAIQSQLKTALDAALAEARRSAQPGQLDVRTGNFSLYPRHSQGGRIAAWQGTAELVLEGRDFARITQLAGRIQTMTVGGVQFGLSREQRSKVETDAQAIAIEQFKARAAELARSFGFSGYGLREVAVHTQDAGIPRPVRSMALAGVPQAEMAVPVEAGKSAVTVTVTGSVQLR